MRWSKRGLREDAAANEDEDLVEYAAQAAQELVDMINWDYDRVTGDDCPPTPRWGSRAGVQRWDRRQRWLDAWLIAAGREIDRRDLDVDVVSSVNLR